MANSDCFPVFFDTSLGTHLGLDVSFDDTIGSLKRKIVAEHLVAFPSIGEINVQAVKLCREGIMYFLSDSMRVYYTFEGIQGTRLLYIEIVSIKHESTITNGRDDEELRVPIEAAIEDLVVSEVPHVDEVLSADPLLKPAEMHLMKRKRKKSVTSEDTAVRLSESSKGKVEGFEGSSVQEEPGYITSKKKREISGQSSNLAHTNLVNFDGENQTLEVSRSGAIACETKKGESMKGYRNDTEDGHWRENSDNRRRKKEKGLEPANDGSVAVGEPHNIKEVAHEASLEEERNKSGMNFGPDSESLQIPEPSRKDDTKKGQSSQEVTQMMGVVSGGVTREKKKRRKAKGLSSDVPSEVLPIRENEPQVEDPIRLPEKEKDYEVPEKSGGAIETQNSIPTQLCKSIEEPEANSRDDKYIGCDNQAENDQTATPDGMEECRKDNPRKKILKESAHVIGGDPGLVSQEKKRHKKKSIFTEVLSQELPSREDEPCKERASNSVLEKETSEAGDVHFINNAAVGSATETDNSIPCQLAKERLEPEIRSPADRDIRFDNQLGVQQAVMADSKEESGKYMEISNETTCVKGVDPGVVSVEKRRHKRKKVTSSKGLPQEARENEPGQEKENDLILEKEIGKEAEGTGLIYNAGGDSGVVSVKKRRHKKAKTSSVDGLDQELLTEEKGYCKEGESNPNTEKEKSKEAGDASLMNTAGGDPGASSKKKRKRKKTKAASTDLLPKEPSAMEKDLSKERESNPIVEKEAGKDARDAHFTDNADGAVLPASNSAGPEDLVKKTASHILSDLKERKPIPSDRTNENVAPQMQLLANVAVYQHKAEQALGLIVETKKEKRKSKKKSVIETENSQDTINLGIGDAVIKHNEKKGDKSAKVISPSVRGKESESRESFGLASSQEDSARKQTLGSNMVEDSVGDGKKRKKTKEEAINPGAINPTAHGAPDEANGTIKESVSQTDGCGKKEPQTKIKKPLKEDNVKADQTFADVKYSKDKSNENGDTGKVSVTSLADIATQNAPNTQENVQKSGDNLAKIQNKEASTEGVQTKDSANFHTPTTEKTNFIDYFLPKRTDQPSDGIKETKGKKKIQNNSPSKDGTSASVDTTVSKKTKKSIGKNGTTEEPVKISKEHNQSETSNSKTKAHASLIDDVPKRDDNMKHLLADMAVTSDASTEDNAEVGSQPRRRMAAVRKVASKSIADKMDASRKKSAVVSSGAVFDDVSSKASTGDETESVNRGSPMLAKEKGRDMMPPSYHWRDERVADDDVPMSQESIRPKKQVNLSSILRSSASFKKAKITASQSQAEDSDLIDVVFETQPGDLA